MVRDTKKETKAYKSAVGGKLNLKAGKFKKSKKKSKKKLKKKKAHDIDGNKTEKKLKDIESNKDINEENNMKDNNKDNTNNKEYKPFKSDFEKAMEELTDSEKQFLERQKMNESYFINKQSQMTHRQRIEQYNNNLAELSEHHDIPKVGPG